jgi:ribosomal protein S18 acetylase RimI-like enzyme
LPKRELCAIIADMKNCKSLDIIKCTNAHLNEVGKLYDNVTKYLEEHVNYPKWTHGEYPSLASATIALNDGSLYCVKQGDKIVSAFVLNSDPQGDYSVGDWSKFIPEGEYMVIHSLAVLDECKGKGVGQGVVKFCIDTAKEQSYKGIRVDVVPGNFPARNLYEKMGFTYAGEKDLNRGYDHIPTFQLLEYNF